jgi:cell division septal protein FtsQ
MIVNMEASTEVIREVTGETVSPQRERPVLYGVFFVLVVAGLLGIVINSSFFYIKAVIVKGNQAVPEETIILATRITRNQSIFTLDRQRVLRAILRNPYIAKAQLFWVFPDQVTIRIVERRAVCLLVRGNSCYRIGNDGVVLGVATEAEQAGLPVVCGARIEKNFQTGAQLNSIALETVMTILKNADRSLGSILRKLDLAQCRLYLKLPGNPDLVMVELGNMERLTEKMANLRAVLAKDQNHDTIRIDLRVPEISTVTAGEKRIR